MSKDRQPWEYADGPAVGREIPITGEPRQEEAPGVPQPPDIGAGSHPPTGIEEREVKIVDPGLSAATNARLTEEVREALGTDRVQVPRDRPRPSRGERPDSRGMVASLSSHRFIVLTTLAAFLTIGAIVSLVTGSWLLLLLAVAVHALGTLTVTAYAIRMTTISERPSASVSAELEDEGVSDPDAHFSALVEEFSEQEHANAADVVAPGDTSRAASASADPSQATAEQSSAMTPTAEPAEPTDGGGAPDALMWLTVAGLLIVSIAIPIGSGGGAMWILPIVMVPVLAAWVLMQQVWLRRRDARIGPDGE